MNLIKKTAIVAASAALISTSAFAVSMEAPVMEPEIIVEETTTGTGGGWVVPLLLVAIIAAVAAD